MPDPLYFQLEDLLLCLFSSESCYYVETPGFSLGFASKNSVASERRFMAES